LDGGTTANYLYDAEGSRNLKLTQTNSYMTEYETWQGQTLSQLDGYVTNVVYQDGGSPIGLPFTDYIYANGSRIATVQSSGDNYISVTGNAGSGGYQQWYDVTNGGNAFNSLWGGAPYVIESGDILAWRQWQSPTAIGGLNLQVSGSGCSTASLVDEDSIPIASDSVTQTWHNRWVDLSGLAGCTVTSLSIGLNTGSTGSGAYADFAEVILYSPASPAIASLYAGGSAAGLSALSGNNMPSGVASYSTAPAMSGAINAPTHFYTTDQVGTAQLEFAGGGWPVWQSEFTPYGHAVSPPSPSANTAVFTGQERDPETADIQNTGMDFMNARYYSSTLGRFTSPDPYLGSMSLTNPQSFNRYTYVQNNPLIFVDPSGLECVWDDGSYDSANDPNTGSQSKCEGGSSGGHWVDPTTFASLGYSGWSAQADSWLADMATSIQANVNTGPLSDMEIGNLGFSLEMSSFTSMPAPNNAPNNTTQVPVHGLWTYGNYCGTGGMGTPINAMDAGCAAHDACYAQNGLTAGGNITGSNPALQSCNQALCNVAESVLAAQNHVGGDLDQANAALQINSYFHGFANIIRSGNRCR